MEPIQYGQHSCSRPLAGQFSGVPSGTCPYTGRYAVLEEPVPSGLISDTAPSPGSCPFNGHYIAHETFSLPASSVVTSAGLCSLSGPDSHGLWTTCIGESVEGADEDALFTASSGNPPPAPPPSPAPEYCQIHASQLQGDMEMASSILQDEYIPLPLYTAFPSYAEQVAEQVAEPLSQQTVTTASVPTDSSRKRKADCILPIGKSQDEQSSRVPPAPQASPVQLQQSFEQDDTRQIMNDLGLIHEHTRAINAEPGSFDEKANRN